MIAPSRLDAVRLIVMALGRGERRMPQHGGDDLHMLRIDDRDRCRGTIAEEMRVQLGAEGGPSERVREVRKLRSSLRAALESLPVRIPGFFTH